MNNNLLLATLLVGLCFTPPLPAKDVVKSKSPDGRFGLRIQTPKEAGEEPVVEIIDLRRKATALGLDCNRGYESEAYLVWSTDSQRVAYYNPFRRGGHTEVYFRDGDSFTPVPLFRDGSSPTESLPEWPPLKFPRTPSPDENNKVITTILRPIRWLKSGALVLHHEVEMLADGRAAQEINIGFNKDRKTSVLKVTPKQVKE